jgi:hypothetical protein
MRRVDRRSSHEHGGETRKSCRHHLIPFSRLWYPLALQSAKSYIERIFENSQSIATSVNEFGNHSLKQSRFCLFFAPHEVNARRSRFVLPRGGVGSE